MRFLDAVLRPAPARVAAQARDAGGARASLASVVEAFNFGGVGYQGRPALVETTWGKTTVERIRDDFVDLVAGGLMADSAVAAVEHVRVAVFSQARPAYARMSGGRVSDIFTTSALGILERPWLGGTFGDLASRMLLHADFAGNSYTIRDDEQSELVQLRPDWTDIILAPRTVVRDPGLSAEGDVLGFRRVGYAYYHGGSRDARPVFLTADEVCHFAPTPDPLANYRGMSWLTPVIREVMADKAATDHKVAFFENAATPNLAVALPREVDPDDFDEFVEKMELTHTGTANAYKTLYLGGGADVTVVGKDFSQLDFKATQGAGETRIAAAGGVGAVLAKLSEGMQGSSLNAGNFSAARRLFTDTTAEMLWQNLAGSLEVLVPYADAAGLPDPAVRMICDGRDIPFLREDANDVAQIQSLEAATMRQLVDAGYTPESVVAAVRTNDWTALKHSGLYSVQLQAPLTGQPAPTPTTPTQGGTQA